MKDEEQNAIMNHFWNAFGKNVADKESHDYIDRVYCVFYNEAGIGLLEKIFKYDFLAEAYVNTQDNPRNYYYQSWSIE